jgi:hypothetical protein
MKKLFLILFLVVGYFANGQILQEPNVYGYKFKRVGSDSLHFIPSDTLQVPTRYNGLSFIANKGGALYYWNGTKWASFSSSGSSYTFTNGITESGGTVTLTNDTTAFANSFYGTNAVGRRGYRPLSEIMQNIYNTDGTLTGNRVVTGGNKTLTFLFDEDLSGSGMTGVNYGSFIGFDAGQVLMTQNGSGIIVQDGLIYQSVSNTGGYGSDINLTKLGGVGIFPNRGNLKIDTLNYTLSTTGKKIMLRDTATGLVQNIDPANLGLNYADSLRRSGLSVQMRKNGNWTTQYTDSVGGSYTFTNGITESGGTVKLGGALTANTEIDVSGHQISFSDVNNFYVESGGATPLADLTELESSLTNINGSNIGKIKITGDSIIFYQTNGNYKFKNIPSTTSTTGRKVLIHDTATGKVERVDPAVLGGGTLVVGAIDAAGSSTDGAIIRNDTLFMQLFGPEFPGLTPAGGDPAKADTSDMLTIDTTGVQDGDVATWDAANNKVVFEAPTGGGSTDSTWHINFKTEVTPGAPNGGDSTLVHPYLEGKVLDIYRDGIRQSESGGKYVLSNDMLKFRPALDSAELVEIIIKDSARQRWIAFNDVISEQYIEIDSYQGTLTESPNNQWNFSGITKFAATATKMTGDGYVKLQTTGQSIIVSLDATTDLEAHTYPFLFNYAFWVNGGVLWVAYLDLQNPPAGINLGSTNGMTHFKLIRLSGEVKLYGSTDGVTFNLLYTYPNTYNGDLYFKGINVIGGTGVIINPKSYGFE